MSIWSLVIGTGILWALTAFAVYPLAIYLTQRRQKVVVCSDGEVTPETTPTPVATECYIIADVLVLGVAGAIIGLALGYFFIGFTWELKSWPGMIAFIVASIVGAALRGAV